MISRWAAREKGVAPEAVDTEGEAEGKRTVAGREVEGAVAEEDFVGEGGVIEAEVKAKAKVRVKVV